jgi:inhibitor of cysteine peptidase
MGDNKVKVQLIIAAVLACALSVYLCACSSGPQVTKEVSCEEFSSQNHITQEVQVSADRTFAVALCSNATTGFKWVEQAEIDTPNIVQQTDHEFVSPEDSLAGSPGQQIWTFKALNKGTCTISFEYSRPWEGGEKGVWTYTLNVTVQ